MLQGLLISCCHISLPLEGQSGENGFNAVFILKVEDKGQKRWDYY